MCVYVVQMGLVRCVVMFDVEIMNRCVMIVVVVVFVVVIVVFVFVVMEGIFQKVGFGFQDQVKKGLKEVKKKFVNICVLQFIVFICYG